MQACRLTAANIACLRGDRLLLSGIGFDCVSGTALHLAGANGIGKSTLLRVLAGLMRPYAGTVTATGAISLADERLPLDPGRPLGAALGFWRRLDGQRGQALPFGLDDLADVPVRYLSTGQRKRAGLALAMGAAPIWLLDEPFNGLDAQWTGVMRALIADHCRDGGIAVIASHLPVGLDRFDVLDLAAHVPEPER